MTEHIHQTIVQPSAEAVQYLKGWKKPRFAYILFETREWHIGHDGSRTEGTGLMTLNVESRPEQLHQVDIYLNKGFRIIDYGNFPKFSDKNPQRAAKALHYSQGAGINPWDNLEQALRQKMKSEITWNVREQALEDELNVLKRKLEEQTEKKAIRDSLMEKKDEKELHNEKGQERKKGEKVDGGIHKKG
jgi:hypothetical protein